MSTAFEYFQQAQLADAVAAAAATVRDAPGDTGARLELLGYLCFIGDFDRIDKHIAVVIDQAPDLAGEMLLYRNLLRGEASRRQCFEVGRLPRFTEPPPDHVQDILRAMTLLDSEPAAAQGILNGVAARAGEMKGALDGQAFTGFRDLDDLTAVVFEVITMGGEYYWIPCEEIRRIVFEDLAEPRDVVWRPGELVSRSGESVKGYFPSLYCGSHASNDDELRVGAAADKVGRDDGPGRGIGGKTFMVGGEARPLATVHEVEFEA